MFSLDGISVSLGCLDLQLTILTTCQSFTSYPFTMLLAVFCSLDIIVLVGSLVPSIAISIHRSSSLPCQWYFSASFSSIVSYLKFLTPTCLSFYDICMYLCPTSFNLLTSMSSRSTSLSSTMILLCCPEFNVLFFHHCVVLVSFILLSFSIILHILSIQLYCVFIVSIFSKS